MAEFKECENNESDLHLLEKQQLLKEKEELEMKIRKQNLIIGALQQLDVSSIPGTDDENKKNIKKALHYVHAHGYLSKNRDQNPLGLSYQPHELTYLEKKSVQTALLQQLSKTYAEPLEYLRNMDKKVLDQTEIDEKIVEMKAKIQQIDSAMPEKQAELCSLLGQCVDLKLGDEKKKLIEAMHATAVVEQQKAEIIELLMAHNYSSATDYVENAFKKLDRFINEKINENTEENSTNSTTKKAK